MIEKVHRNVPVITPERSMRIKQINRKADLKMDIRKDALNLSDEELQKIYGGGHTEEWEELRDWAIRHNPEWEGKDPSKIGDGPVTRFLFINIPEYDGGSWRDDGPTTYYVKGQSKPTMNHAELMALLTSRYGA